MSDDTMTLAFELRTLERLADPAAVFEDARQWSTYVGVISDQLAYQVVNYLRDNGIYNEDFFSRADKRESLTHMAQQTATDRHVFIGSTSEDGQLARETGWEYLSVEKAAEKAEWELATTAPDQ